MYVCMYVYITRLMVTGPWATDMLRDEYRWRLGLFRDYLKIGKNNKKRTRTRQQQNMRGAVMEDEEEEEYYR